LSAPIAIALLDESGRLREVNGAFVLFLDLAPQHLVGRNLTEVIKEVDHNKVIRLLSSSNSGDLQLGPIEVRFNGTPEKIASLFLSKLEDFPYHPH
jgi:PAS domain S-box-containing protein